MPRSWESIFPKLTKKTTQLKYDSFVMAIQSLLDCKHQYTRVLSEEHIDRYVLRIGAPPRPDRALVPPPSVVMNEEVGDDDDDDSDDNA